MLIAKHKNSLWLIIRYKKLADTKRLLSRSATGWMLHYNVRNTNCLLNNMSFCLIMWTALFFAPFICLARPCSRFAYGVSCLASSLKMRHGERGLMLPRCPPPRHVTPAPRNGSNVPCGAARERYALSVTLWALLLIPGKTQASQKQGLLL